LTGCRFFTADSLFRNLFCGRFFCSGFLVTGFFLMVFFLIPVVLPRVLRALVLATFFLELRFFVFADAACVAFLPVVPLMFIQGDPLGCSKEAPSFPNPAVNTSCIIMGVFVKQGID
jgi:hypothetical protein